MKDRQSVLIIGDSHIPFNHPDYLDFCLDIKKRCKCSTVVHIGDFVDFHSISYYEHDPDGRSPKDEYELALKEAKVWYKAFPRVKLCRGNHDRLIDRRRKTAGLPKVLFKSYRKIWELPPKWEDKWEYKIDGVLYEHGTSYSGKYPHLSACNANRCSTVIGHLHSVAGIEWTANSNDCIFGMSVSCGIERRTYAFNYGRDFRRKPILGCGVVTDKGRFCQWFPMSL